MKKLLPFIIVILAAVGIGYNLINKDSSTSSTGTLAGSSNPSDLQANQQGGLNPTGEDNFNLAGENAMDENFEDVKPAAVAYKSTTEALAALKRGAVDYDDLILEQFTNPGEDCTFCPELYGKVKDLLNDPSVNNEEKAFYAEILAISGKADNVKSLIDGYKSASSVEQKELLASALELVSGGEDIVKMIGSELSTENSDLKESLVAALTNQGSALAFNTLFDHVVSSGNTDGYSSLGIGPGEMMVDDQALQEAQKRALKKDQYSPLAVKAMLNSGLPGLRMVFDILSTSTDIESDRRLIKDAVEHVGYDEQIEKYLQEKSNSSSPLAKEFAQQILQDYAQQEEAMDLETIIDDETMDEAPMTKIQ